MSSAPSARAASTSFLVASLRFAAAEPDELLAPPQAASRIVATHASKATAFRLPLTFLISTLLMCPGPEAGFLDECVEISTLCQDTETWPQSSAEATRAPSARLA